MWFFAPESYSRRTLMVRGKDYFTSFHFKKELMAAREEEGEKSLEGNGGVTELFDEKRNPGVLENRDL